MTNLSRGESVAHHIENARRVEGRSVTWLAEVTGIAEKTLRRRLVAPERFTLAELSSVANALHTDLEHLIVGSKVEQAVAG